MATQQKQTTDTSTTENTIAQQVTELHFIAPTTTASGKTIEKFTLKLSSLVSLDQLPFSKEQLALAMRPIDKANLVSLLSADERAIPEIEVQNTEPYGWVLVGGNHRLMRAYILARKQYHTSKATDHKPQEDNPNFDLLAWSEKLPKPSLEEQAFIDSQKIRCTALNCTSLEGLIIAANRSNIRNGKALDQSNASKYAHWFYLTTGCSKRKAADEAGIKHPTLVIYIQRLEARIAKEEAEKADPTQAAQRAQLELAEKSAELLVKACVNFIKAYGAERANEAATYLGENFIKAADISSVTAMSTILKAASTHAQSIRKAETTESK